MNKIGVIAWREIRSYFSSWLAYVLLAGWMFIAAQNFALSISAFDRFGEFSLQGLFSVLILIMLFVAPIITMRLVVEERSQGTLEMLFTSPITEWQVAVGKFFGAWGFLAIMLLLTGHLPYFANRYGSVDMGPVWGGYIALAVVGAAFVAYGLFCSAVTNSQVVAGFLTFGGLLFSWMMAFPAQIAPDNDFAAFIGHLSIFSHFQGMMGGAVDTKDLIFFASVTLFFLYATVRTLESRKWS
jgi:ABC-2 type transport system permease protein